ncbi:MAG: hypothetical protein AAFR04_15140 [Pseudomonadota bacterium]
MMAISFALLGIAGALNLARETAVARQGSSPPDHRYHERCRSSCDACALRPMQVSSWCDHPDFISNGVDKVTFAKHFAAAT